MIALSKNSNINNTQCLRIIVYEFMNEQTYLLKWSLTRFKRLISLSQWKSIIVINNVSDGIAIKYIINEYVNSCNDEVLLGTINIDGGEQSNERAFVIQQNSLSNVIRYMLCMCALCLWTLLNTDKTLRFHVAFIFFDYSYISKPQILWKI